MQWLEPPAWPPWNLTMIPTLSTASRAGMPRPGLTLIELIVVLTILIALAGLAVPLVGGNAERARGAATETTLQRLRDVILNRYLVDVSVRIPVEYPIDGSTQTVIAPPTIRALFQRPPDVAPYHPTTQLGWNGPYFLETGARFPSDPDAVARGFTEPLGLPGEPAVLDSWGNPIVIRPEWVEQLDADNNPVPVLFWKLVSAGRDGNLNTTGDNVVLPLQPVEFVNGGGG
jgi:type II secretory pathway pseudopilin PulG